MDRVLMEIGINDVESDSSHVLLAEDSVLGDQLES